MFMENGKNYYSTGGDTDCSILVLFLMIFIFIALLSGLGKIISVYSGILVDCKKFKVEPASYLQ
jgi:hypothetical protein